MAMCRRLRWWCVVAVVLVCESVSAAVKTFNSGLFTFTYPTTYASVPVKEGSHMAMKLKSENGNLTISVWDGVFKRSADIWDDRLYERLLDYAPPGERVSMEKTWVETANGKMHCIKMKANLSEYRVKFLVYYLINEGSLYVVGHMLPGSYTKTSRTVYEDGLMKGLYFKPVGDTPSQERDRETVKAYFMGLCKELNSQLPAEVDEITTLYAVVFYDWTFFCTYQVDMDFSVFSDEEMKELKQIMYEDGKEVLRSIFTQGDPEWAKVALPGFREYGIKVRVTYKDANGRMIFSLLYDYRDL